MNLGSEKECPCCGRHCSVENLHCPRGRAHFGQETVEGQEDRHNHHNKFKYEENMTVDDKVIALMRGCGHYLHHSMGAENSKELLLMLSEDEKRVLGSLLKKCLKAWND